MRVLTVALIFFSVLLLLVVAIYVYMGVITLIERLFPNYIANRAAKKSQKADGDWDGALESNHLRLAWIREWARKHPDDWRTQVYLSEQDDRHSPNDIDYAQYLRESYQEGSRSDQERRYF